MNWRRNHRVTWFLRFPTLATSLWLGKRILKLEGDNCLKGFGAKDKEACHLFLNSTANPGNRERREDKLWQNSNIGESIQGSANYGPRDQIWPSCYVFIKFYWHMAMPIPLCVIYGGFCTTAEPMVMRKTVWPTKLKIFTIWSFTGMFNFWSRLSMSSSYILVSFPLV